MKYLKRFNEGTIPTKHEAFSMKELTEKQIDRIIDSAEVEMETNGELTWTTSKLIIRALKQIKN